MLRKDEERDEESEERTSCDPVLFLPPHLFFSLIRFSLYQAVFFFFFFFSFCISLFYSNNSTSLTLSASTHCSPSLPPSSPPSLSPPPPHQSPHPSLFPRCFLHTSSPSSSNQSVCKRTGPDRTGPGLVFFSPRSRPELQLTVCHPAALFRLSTLSRSHKRKITSQCDDAAPYWSPRIQQPTACSAETRRGDKVTFQHTDWRICLTTFMKLIIIQDDIWRFNCLIVFIYLINVYSTFCACICLNVGLLFAL